MNAPKLSNADMPSAARIWLYVLQVGIALEFMRQALISGNLNTLVVGLCMVAAVQIIAFLYRL